MSYLALYRKYRPESFEEVIGQENAVNVLTSSIKQKKISHAYLFSGGRGTGKTTVARIVARAIGCDSMDIIEIDAASNRGIDEIRELREAVRTAPFASPYKVYIVDEAHMLTKEAANALLKTLEEPPVHVVFILATTDPEKLPSTIVSRCQRITFNQPDIEVLADTLIKVAEKEGRRMERGSGELIAGHAKGSYRDALGILEQVLSISKKEIDHDSVLNLLGVSQEENLLKLLYAICEKNEKNVLSATDELKSKNISAIRAYDQFIELVRKGLVARVDPERATDAEIKKIATTYPNIIGSKMIINLLERRNLLEVSDTYSWDAFLAVMLYLLEY